MSTELLAEVQADLEALCRSIAAGQPIDPALAQRVQERAKIVREEVFQRHGALDVAVDLVREGREE